MSAKFVYNLSDERPDIGKQIGCMNGIFQLFERHHFLGGSRRYIGQHQKRLPSPGENGNNAKEHKSASPGTMEKDYKKGTKEKHRASTESSRTSFSSSSCSSSLSSLESTRASQLEPSSFSQSITMESHRRELQTLPSSWQSSDFRDVVKDSIYRETREISVKTATKGESGGQTLKYIDSPRPIQHQKFMVQKSSGLKESTRVLHQPRGDMPCKSTEGTHNSSIKDVRRFSLDGRESRDNYKSTMKIKELPRFSLDSRAGSDKGSTAEVRRSYPTQEMGRNGNSTDLLNQPEPGSNRRPSGLVAKLMGLEAIPEPIIANSNQTREFTAHIALHNDAFSRSSRTINEHYQYQNASSPRYLNKELSSPRPVTADSIKRHPVKSKSSIEPAPSSQPDASRVSPSPSFADQAAPAKSQTSSLSVFGEIEKRLPSLEFNGKDLRALIQIIEGMHKNKDTFETRSDDSGWVSHSSRNSCLELTVDDQQSSTICSSSARGTSSAECLTSPIVIMKSTKPTGQASHPAMLANHTNDMRLDKTRTADSTGIRKKSNSNSTAKDLTRSAKKEPNLKTNDLTSHPTRLGEGSSSSRLIKSPPTRKEPPYPTRESTIVCRNLGTGNPRNQQKKLQVEKKSHPTTLTDAKSSIRKSSRQLTQTSPTRRKPGPKSPSMQLRTDVNTEVGDLSQTKNSMSQQSDSNNSIAFQVDEENLCLDGSDKIIKAVLQQRCARHKEPAGKSTEDKFDACTSILSEQPSPVSVLDAKFYNDELPSPIKKISTSFKGVDSDDEMGWDNNDTCQSSGRMISENSGLDHKEVEDIKPLIQHLKQISSADELIASGVTLYNLSSSEHQYISEIVLASRFLGDFETIYRATQLTPTAYPIKPGFFLALEEAKASLKETVEIPTQPTLAKTQRKLLFDVTNEILVQKLARENPKIMWNAQSTTTQKLPGLPLCQELLSELDKLKSNHSACIFDNDKDKVTSILREDMMHQSVNWTSGLNEMPGLVLDLERMIFKDLITEVVTGEISRLQLRSAAQCRQLFSN